MGLSEIKSPLPYETLRDVIDLCLWAGQLLLQHGAESARIEETVHHIGTGLGCDWMDVLISSGGIVITAISGDDFRTKARRVPRLGVDFAIIDGVNDLSRRASTGQIDRHVLRAELRRVSDAPPLYKRWQVVGMVGLACMAFARLFGADVPVMAVTFGASSAAMAVRQVLTRRHFNMFMVVGVTAFVAGMIASLATLWEVGARPDLALAASVLLLVPGVPLITSVQDILGGNTRTGVGRGMVGAMVTLSIAIGLALAMGLMGVE